MKEDINAILRIHNLRGKAERGLLVVLEDRKKE